MCEIWEEIKNKGKLEGLREGESIGKQAGLAEGKILGRQQGVFEERINSIKKLMRKNGYTLEEALDFLDIPKEERSTYIGIFTS